MRGLGNLGINCHYSVLYYGIDCHYSVTKQENEMFDRLIYQSLIHWSTKSNRKPLILRGARQVGKTTVVNAFSKKYDCYLKLNLELKKDRDLFETNNTVHELLAGIYFQHNRSPQPTQKTLLFIDEIQYCPKAITLLRYFFEERNDIHVIAAGSLLETAIDQHISIPVGRVEYLWMYPLTFSEYLLAANETEALKLLQTIPCPAFAHQKLLSLFHEYALVGGMPEAVKIFLEKKDIVQTNEVYQTLMTGFDNDVEKYARNQTVAHVMKHVIARAPFSAGERIQFKNFGESHYQSREIGEALRTLEKSMLLKLIYPTIQTIPPATIDFKKSPRLQFLDCGLVNYVSGLQSHFFNISDLSALYRGRLIENIVGQILLATQPQSNPLTFWVRENAQSNAEVDFVMNDHQHLIPIEIKSGKTGTLRSLHSFMDLTNHETAIRLYANTIQTDFVKTSKEKSFQLLSLPYYLASQIQLYLKI